MLKFFAILCHVMSCFAILNRMSLYANNSSMMLQLVAICYFLPCDAVMCFNSIMNNMVLQSIAICCNTLHYAACNMLRYVTIYCNIV